MIVLFPIVQFLLLARPLTDDIVERGVIGAGEEVGEEVDHDETLLLALK